jgi:glycosyltransferase involved in cell wall biosynthesis
VTYLRRRRFARRRMGALADEAAFGLQCLARLARRPPDVWHALGTADAAAAALLGTVRRGLRTCYTDLGFPAAEARRNRPDRILHDLVVRRIDHYICMSDAAATYLEDGYGRQAAVVTGGVDVGAFARPRPREDVPTIMWVADADEPRKHLDLLLGAAGLLLQDGPLNVWVVGPGDQQAALDAAPCEVRERTELLGSLPPDDLADRYGRAWVMCLPSEAEAFGMVFVEALASGTPVVGLSSGGGPATIIKPGIGITCEPSPASVAQACREAFALASRPTTATACRDAARWYDWRLGITPRLETLYRSPRST